ncbi:uncharacterized protein JCM15063_003574 [Sporobolomyces koalae]|uniref:uncharacterized protein n=1 Tax=Sporobolomyces koalae TaxID=500713 RepID=UPI00316ED109
MGSTNATITGVKTVPSAVALHPSSLSSKHPLVALTSPSNPGFGTPNQSKVSLYRTGTIGSDLVWEWTNVGIPPKATGLGLNKKPKAAPVGNVEQIAWSPDNTFLAVAISPATPTSDSTLAILSLHSGQPLESPPISLPTSASITHLSWQSFEYPVDVDLSSWSIDFVRKLPGLPKIKKENSTSSGPGGTGSAMTGGPALGNFTANSAGGGGGGGGGVFGAKQAMLERERAKEAQRALNLREAAIGGFPTVLSDQRPDEVEATGDAHVRAMLRTKGARHDETERSLLCVGDDKGYVHLYLGGNIYVGSVDHRRPTGESTAIVGVRVLPTSPDNSKVQFAVYTADPMELLFEQMSLPIPPSLRVIIRQSSALRATLQHAFEALQEVRNLWDESRRIGKGWLQRVADVSRPQGVVLPPTTQLHLLLMTGRPTRSLHDFLASKMNERGLVKWEQEMGIALDRMKRVGWMSVVPALERAIILLLEVDAWARWPAKFDMYRFDRKTILKAIEVAKEVIKATVRLQPVVEEEERCFKAFSIWLHYELDKLAQQEGSEVRPVAAFHPVPVSSYIQHSLSAQTSPIDPFLTMGLASMTLAQNSFLTSGQKWVDQLEVNQGRESVTRESFEAMSKRLSEEFKGQKERDELESQGRSTVGAETGSRNDQSFAIESPATAPFAKTASSQVEDIRPPALGASETNAQPPPASISVLLHLVGKLVGETMSTAVRRVGSRAFVDFRVLRGSCETAAAKGPRLRTTTLSDQRMCEAWVGDTILNLAVHDLARVEKAAYKLETKTGTPIEILEMAFLPGDQLALAVDQSDSAASKPVVITLDLQSVPFTPAPTSPSPLSLPLDRTVHLDSHFPPSHVALATLHGRRIACSLAGEGRRLEILDLGSLTSSSQSSDEMDLQ